MSKPFNYYQNDVIAVVPAAAARSTSLTDAFDENPSLVALDAARDLLRRVAADVGLPVPARSAVEADHAARGEEAWTGSGFSLSRDGRSVAFVASSPTDFPDVYLGQIGSQAG